MGIFLPLITTNCAILGFAIMGVQNSYSFIETVIFGLGAGLGFTLALMLMASIREDLRFADIPKPLRGVGIAFILAGLLSLAFGGFAGLV
jgi:electron transport complex protein RnfA